MGYILEFSKNGKIKYISHLDLQRLFKRAFKATGISLAYSQGYNPHPKMGFAQPLSLGYTANQEYLEFQTEVEFDSEEIKAKLQEALPGGIRIVRVEKVEDNKKSLASFVVAAVYGVRLPVLYHLRHEDVEELVQKYLKQEEIIAKKRDKKTKKYIDKDIKNQIRNITVEAADDDCIELIMEVDSGSGSNLSPEQVISSFTEFSKLYLPREEIQVERKYLIFDSCIPHTMGLHLQENL